jgi:hypothetical protein
MVNTKLQKEVSNQLFRLGMKMTHTGYYYFKQGILIIIEKLKNHEVDSYKRVYYQIAEDFNKRDSNRNTNYKCIARGLTYTLKWLWKHGNQQEINLVFGRNATSLKPLTAIVIIANKIYEDEAKEI